MPHPLEDGIGLWSERLVEANVAGRPALFLDRDGVVVEEVHYLGHPDRMRMIPGVAAAIAAVNRLGIPVVLVTNQAGIARGYYDWAGFRDVQSAIDVELAKDEARFDLVLACGFHEAGSGALKQGDHPWRKPNCGMLTHAKEILSVDLSRSFVVGDKLSDLVAGQRAGLRGGALVLTGYGREDAALMDEHRREWDRSGGFEAVVSQTAATAIETWLAASNFPRYAPTAA